MRIARLLGEPIISPASSPSIGDNINGPSLIRVPDWVEKPLGKYYLYFGHHRGTFIRLAYADRIEGPWKIYEPGLLHVDAIPHISHDPDGIGHIASPEIVIDDAQKRIIMYYHATRIGGKLRDQVSFAAVSSDGLNFRLFPDEVGPIYIRAFMKDGYTYSVASTPALSKTVAFRRSANGLNGWEKGPELFDGWSIRHVGLLKKGDLLRIFFTRCGDAPEHIEMTTLDISGDWSRWKEGDAVEVMRPETDYEGALIPPVKSAIGPVHGPENSLRDPFVYEEDGKCYLFYCTQGEGGIALAQVLEES